jgi:uncharacterized membrane protein required for colicin V production
MNPALPADIPLWVLVCLSFWMLGCLWIGWTRGLVRQALSIVALLGGIAGGIFLGPVLSPMVPALGFPVFARPLVAGVIVGIVLWVISAILSAIIFKKTEHQSVGFIRLIYGSTGALLGTCYGLLVLVIAGFGVRLLGSFVEGVNQSSSVRARAGARHQQPPVSALVTLKQALEQGSLAAWLARVDPLPVQLYSRLQKAGQLLCSPEALERLFASREFAPLARHPKILALREDSDLQERLKAGDLIGALRNPKLRAALNDTQIQTALGSASLERQVDEALAPPAPVRVLREPR